MEPNEENEENQQFLENHTLYLPLVKKVLAEEIKHIAKKNEEENPQLLIIQTAQDALTIVKSGEVLIAERNKERRNIVLPFPLDVFNLSRTRISLDDFVATNQSYESGQIDLDAKQYNEILSTMHSFEEFLERRVGHSRSSELKDVFGLGIDTLYGLIKVVWQGYTIIRVMPRRNSKGSLKAENLLKKLEEETKAINQAIAEIKSPASQVNRIYKYK